MATLPPLTANIINLVSLTDGKLLHVSLYTGHAELRRLFKFNVQAGQNQLYINSLLNDIQDDSLRVQGHGDAVIHNVSLSFIPWEPASTKMNLVQSAISQCQTASRALESYISSITVVDVPLDQVGVFIDTYSAQARKIDEELARLRKEEIELYREIRAGVAVGLSAESEGEVEVELLYAVSFCSWEAVYNIHVGLEERENPQTVLVYKAVISQNTGEDWTDVPLTLKTTTPSYGAQILKLKSLKLSSSKPPSRHFDRGRRLGHEHYQPCEISIDYSRSRTPSPVRQPPPRAVGLNVTSKGDGQFSHLVFQVPGLISVSGDGRMHRITVIELKELETKLWWLAVPKRDTSVLLNAKIKNTSPYVLMPGNASMYVDGTFISRSKIPVAGPEETIDCSLGFDSSIKITEHPISSKISHHLSFTGFNSLRSFGTTKTTSTLYSRRITILNAKPIRIDALKLLDQIPVSESEGIMVKILKPAELNKPGKSSGSEAGRDTGATASIPTPVQSPLDTGRVQITAQWDSADADKELPLLPGSRNTAKSEGKMSWLLYDIPAQGTVNLVTEWEVLAASSLQIFEQEE
ncbi:hypothetical protein GYMLUDRAFT_1004166 [Collybiopsis luxurians FD-317 M1]|uniref:Mucoidy inhibitor A n=1 Tax=Collybiopsis luxurians FD-317 M1 TaxID=944289 RepID=A0A0D0CAH3_9AGAR|nr:hypothetical protein GYMLUDRAFT_1004166 [Collybiopsis luxurians FD-317 M1]